MTTTADDLREEVRRRYAESARDVIEGTDGCGCGSGSCCSESETDASDDFGEALYDAEERGELPEAAVLASLGCGNPTAVAELREGETVLDLGSGGGIDVLLSAKRVGPTGIAYGVDMTDEMLALARAQRRRGRRHERRLPQGPDRADPAGRPTRRCRDLQLRDQPVDRQASGAGRDRRVLRPGGRIGISDVVAEDQLSPEPSAPSAAATSAASPALCPGASTRPDWRLRDSSEITVEFTHQVRRRDARRHREGGEDPQPVQKGLPIIEPAAKAGCC